MQILKKEHTFLGRSLSGDTDWDKNVESMDRKNSYDPYQEIVHQDWFPLRSCRQDHIVVGSSFFHLSQSPIGSCDFKRGTTYLKKKKKKKEKHF